MHLLQEQKYSHMWLSDMQYIQPMLAPVNCLLAITILETITYLHGPRHTPWFNLYCQRSSGGGFWDYYTQVPELGCRGGFGLHSGDYSEGCITVTSSSCFNRLRNEIISNFPVIYFNVYECRNCHQGWWGSGYQCSWTQTVSRPCTADLQSNN